MVKKALSVKMEKLKTKLEEFHTEQEHHKEVMEHILLWLQTLPPPNIVAPGNQEAMEQGEIPTPAVRAAGPHFVSPLKTAELPLFLGESL